MAPIKSLMTAALAVMLVGSYGLANASFTSCADLNPDITTRVSTALDCDVLNPIGGNANDSPQPGFVNTALFFGFDDWQFDGKFLDDDPNAPLVDLFTFTGDAEGGSFTYNVANTIEFTDIMFVFKDGSGTNLVGYLVPAADGTYSNPFTDPPFNLSGSSEDHNISHISVYFRDGGGTIIETPEPGTLALLALGMLGLVRVARRWR